MAKAKTTSTTKIESKPKKTRQGRSKSTKLKPGQKKYRGQG
jgi:hypothetical protein